MSKTLPLPSIFLLALATACSLDGSQEVTNSFQSDQPCRSEAFLDQLDPSDNLDAAVRDFIDIAFGETWSWGEWEIPSHFFYVGASIQDIHAEFRGGPYSRTNTDQGYRQCSQNNLDSGASWYFCFTPQTQASSYIVSLQASFDDGDVVNLSWTDQDNDGDVDMIQLWKHESDDQIVLRDTNNDSELDQAYMYSCGPRDEAFNF